jgi:acetyltransferase-like isoleucine patch superfamily enzyme
MRTVLKQALDGLATLVVSPLAAISALEKYALPGSEEGFHFGAHLVSLCPGLPGVYVRRAFYRLTLDGCARECYFAFGAVFTHRTVTVERGVYLGTFALVGSAHLREGTSVGSRASLLSGTELHEFKDGRWTGYDVDKLRQIRVGPHALIGEGAIVMADVGSATLIAAGAVVANAVPDGVVMAGNPARFVRRLERDVHEPS